MQRVGRLSLSKRAGMPQPVRHKLRPAYVEGTLDVDVEMSSDQLKRTANPP